MKKKMNFRQRLGRSVVGIAARLSGDRFVRMPQSIGYTGVPSRSKRMRGWQMGSGSAATETLPDLPELRSASSDLIRNTPLASGAMHTNVSGVIGTGLQFRPALRRELLGLSRKDAQQKSDEITRELNLAFKTLSWEGNIPWIDLQEIILRGVLEKGDIGIARRYQKRPGDAYGLKIVLIEGERISNPDNKPDSDRIKGGVQFSNNGKVEGYHFTKHHPGDIAKAEDRQWSYVPATGQNGLPLMLLPMVHLRPGQPRGVPYLAPIMELAKLLSDYTVYEANAAKNAAKLFGFIETQAAGEFNDGEHVLDTGGSDVKTDDDEINIEDGLIVDLPEGQSIKIPEHGRPNSGFDPFVVAILRQIGVALEIPFELLIKHFTASYTASRAALELAWQYFKRRRGWLSRHALNPIVEWVLEEAVASGRLDLPGFQDDPVKRQAWLTGEWLGSQRMSIDPLKEAKADEVDIKTRVKTRQQVMIERTGGQFDEKHDQLAHEDSRIARDAQVMPGSETSQDDDTENDEDEE